jgi:NHL repeat
MTRSANLISRFPGTAVVLLLLACGYPCAAQSPRHERGIEEFDGSTIITLVAGPDTPTSDQNRIVSPFGIGFDTRAVLYFVEMTGQRVRKLGQDGTVATIVGTGRQGNTGDNGPAGRAELNGPHSLAVARNGDIFVADTWNNRIRKVDARSGSITSFAGTGKKGFSGDRGPAAQAEFGGIYCLALDETNHVLALADLDNRRIRQIDLKTGIVTTTAGNGKKGVPVEGDDAVKAPLVDPRAVALDGRGNIFILERSGHALRVVDHSGRIHNLAGTGQPGDSGDGGDARHARLNGPKHLCVSPKGNVLIADTENHRIRIYDPGRRTIATIVGTGRKGTAGVGGPASNAELSQPHGVTIGPDGALFIADSSNNRILKVAP